MSGTGIQLDSTLAFQWVLHFARLIVLDKGPQGPKPEFICDVVDPTTDPTTFVVKDNRGKDPVDVLRVGYDEAAGRYALTRISPEKKYDGLVRAVEGNVGWIQGELTTPGQTKEDEFPPKWYG